MAGPCLIAILASLTPDHPVVPVEEQWISVGAGLQNLLLAALSLELHAKCRVALNCEMRNPTKSTDTPCP
jgi:hypothetical protein